MVSVMGRRRNKSSNKRKPKLTFTDSPDKEPMRVLCSPVYNAEHPVTATRILVDDIDNLPWVSPQFNPLHFTEQNKCRRRRKKGGPQDDTNVDKKLTNNPKRFGRLQFDNEERVCMSKQLGNNRKIGLELTFKKQRRRKTVKGDLSDISDVELSDQENTDHVPVDHASNKNDLNDFNIAELFNNVDEHTKLKENHGKVLAIDTPERDYGIHVNIRRRRDILPPYARQKLMDAAVK